jgi:hypothetical protein
LAAAFLAISARRSAVSLSRRAAPPFPAQPLSGFVLVRIAYVFLDLARQNLGDANRVGDGIGWSFLALWSLRHAVLNAEHDIRLVGFPSPYEPSQMFSPLRFKLRVCLLQSERNKISRYYQKALTVARIQKKTREEMDDIEKIRIMKLKKLTIKIDSCNLITGANLPNGTDLRRQNLIASLESGSNPSSPNSYD